MLMTGQIYRRAEPFRRRLARFADTGGILHVPAQRDVMGLAKLSCLLWGHHVDNHVFKQADGRRPAVPVWIRLPG